MNKLRTAKKKEKEIEKLAALIGMAMNQPKETCLSENCATCVLNKRCNMETRYAYFLIKNGVTLKA